MNNENALILFSGGQDSTTCLYWAKERFNKVVALSISYGQRHEQVEFEAATKIASLAGIELRTFDLGFISKISDSVLVSDGKVNGKHRASAEMPAPFVPGRNLVFVTVAAMLGYKWGITNIVSGSAETYSAYPDNYLVTLDYLSKAISSGMGKKFILHTPLLHLDKAGALKMAENLDGCWEALSYSHTCYEGFVPPCGSCPACINRKKGFREIGRIDPLLIRLKDESKS